MSQRRVCPGASPSLCPRDWRAWLGNEGVGGRCEAYKGQGMLLPTHTHRAMKINRDDLWGVGEENFKGA